MKIKVYDNKDREYKMEDEISMECMKHELEWLVA
jgi:hypothetical protein